MGTTIKEERIESVITSAELLDHWQGHRRLTRRVIEAFSEADFFNYSIGGMRSFAVMVDELLAIAVPGLMQMIDKATEPINESFDHQGKKENVLKLWDEATEQINSHWARLTDDRFHEKTITFGQYEGTVLSSILYFIDNEIHHRAQATVYLRSLGIQPPFFWER